MHKARFKDWLICSAASFLLFMAGLSFPFLALPATMIFSLPFAFLALDRGTAAALSCAAFVMLAMGFAVPISYVLMYSAMFALPGVFMGALARRAWNVGNLLVASVGAEFAGKIAAVLMYFRVSGVNLLSPDTAEIEKFMMSLGGTATELQIRAISSQVVMLIPYSIMLFSALEALFCLTLASCIHKKRTGETAFPLPPFSEWAFPKSTLLALASGLVCSHFSSGRANMYAVAQIGVNLVEMSRTLFLVQGLSCMYYFMEMRGFPKFMRVMAVIFAPVVSIFGYALAIAGVVDMGFNLRKKSGRA
ncbi:MAG: YybS family protein [Synergistaceae bacterium]|jgi:uncharacterized protein YybS (DUF2232 family)|nr:YybS family protein [Synergistaceae bacterium]